MELVTRGWTREQGKVIKKKDLADAQVGEFDFHSRDKSEIYVTSTPYTKNINPHLGCERVSRKGHVDIRFHAKIVLGGDYLVRLTLNRQEIANLFFLQYGATIDELIRSFREFESIHLVVHKRTFPKFKPIMFKRIEELEFSEITTSFLKSANIEYIGDLVQKTQDEILLGHPDRYLRLTALPEINEKLPKFDLKLEMRVPGWPTYNPEMLRTIDKLNLLLRFPEGIKYVGDLVLKTQEELSRYMAPQDINKVEEALAPMGLGLGMEAEDWPHHTEALAELFADANTKNPES